MSSENYKILYLSHGGSVYGAQRQLLYLLKGLNRNRFSPVVLRTEEGPFLQELEDLHVTCGSGWDATPGPGRRCISLVPHSLKTHRTFTNAC